MSSAFCSNQHFTTFTFILLTFNITSRIVFIIIIIVIIVIIIIIIIIILSTFTA